MKIAQIKTTPLKTDIDNRPNLFAMSDELRELGIKHGLRLASFGGMASMSNDGEAMYLAVWSKE